VPSQRAFHKQGRVASQSWLPQRKIRSGDLRSATLGASALGSRALAHLPDLALRDASFFFLQNQSGSWHRGAPAASAQIRPRASGVGSHCTLRTQIPPGCTPRLQWGSVAACCSTAVTAGFVRGHQAPVTTNNRRFHRGTHHRCARMGKRSNISRLCPGPAGGLVGCTLSHPRPEAEAVPIPSA
jgi:hypothetical protein